MLKQAAQVCRCGNVMAFPEGQIRAKCKSCGAIWELGQEGYWAISVNPSRKPEIRLYEIYKRLVRSFAKTLKPAVVVLVKWTVDFWDKLIEMTAKRICKKWLYYYKHSKKRRIRKKYRRMIQTRLMKIFIALSKNPDRISSQTKEVYLKELIDE